MNEHDAILHHAQTDVGLKRSHNQDSYGVALAPNQEAWETRGHLFVVADGMGAHAVGELASKLAVDTLQLTYTKLRDLSPLDALRKAFVEANQTIHDRGRRNREFRGMGTTATALLLLPDGAVIGHVGDSRCYRISGPRIEQLSFDHSLQWEMARKQKVRPEELTSVPSNIIVRSLGPEAKVRIDMAGPYAVEQGDRFLLCSDGLSGPVSDSELWAVVSHLPAAEACQFLVDLANLRGGIDNITVLLVQVGEPVAANEKEEAAAARRLTQEHVKETLKKVPLPWWFLLTGLAVSGVGELLRMAELPGVLFFLLLGIVLLAAAWGLAFYRRRNAEKEQTQVHKRVLPVHRSQECSIERRLVEKLAHTEQHLRELAIEDSWKVDWTELHRKRAEADEFLKAERLHDAFREYCRTISLLSAGLRQRRDKTEMFNPNFKAEEV